VVQPWLSARNYPSEHSFGVRFENPASAVRFTTASMLTPSMLASNRSVLCIDAPARCTRHGG
jgi:hypothetical protein